MRLGYLWIEARLRVEEGDRGTLSEQLYAQTTETQPAPRERRAVSSSPVRKALTFQYSYRLRTCSGSSCAGTASATMTISATVASPTLIFNLAAFR